MTSAKGQPNVNDYKSLVNVYHGKEQRVCEEHKELDQGVHRLMKKTNYSIGVKGDTAPNEKQSSHNTYFL